MSWYALKARQPGRWTEAERFNWIGNDFPLGITSEFPDPDGVSVYEVQSDADPLLEELATTFGFYEAKGNFGKVVFRFAEAAFVVGLGIKVRMAPATFKGMHISHAISANHRELHELTGAKVVNLARHMKDQTLKEFPASKIGDMVANHLIQNPAADWKLDGDKLAALHSVKRISIV